MRLTSGTQFRFDPLVFAVSRLTDDEIRAMDRRDLLDVIRLSRGLKARRAACTSLATCTHETLVSFALIVRDKCRIDLHLEQRYRRFAAAPGDAR